MERCKTSSFNLLIAAVVALCMVELSCSVLVKEQPLVLKYHNGPLLTVATTVDVHVIWYGSFSPVQRSIVGDFVQSLGGVGKQQPSVSTWWKTTEGYRGGASASNGPAKTRLGVQTLDQNYSLGKLLKRADIIRLVRRAASFNKSSGSVLYLVLTSKDVAVERFCMSSCGFHSEIVLKGEKRVPVRIPYAWVGNSETQCPGQCAWPFHQPIYGPQTPPLLPPNGDVGIDGMIINIGTVLAGAVTNPFNTGYFQGDARAPLEAVSACPGIYGKGAYPGYPGNLLVDKTTGASFNSYGVNGRAFLVPAMWDPFTRACKTIV